MPFSEPADGTAACTATTLLLGPICRFAVALGAAYGPLAVCPHWLARGHKEGLPPMWPDECGCQCKTRIE